MRLKLILALACISANIVEGFRLGMRDDEDYDPARPTHPADEDDDDALCPAPQPGAPAPPLGQAGPPTKYDDGHDDLPPPAHSPHTPPPPPLGAPACTSRTASQPYPTPLSTAGRPYTSPALVNPNDGLTPGLTGAAVNDGPREGDLDDSPDERPDNPEGVRNAAVGLLVPGRGYAIGIFGLMIWAL